MVKLSTDTSGKTNSPIDVIITWVDSSDPDVAKKLENVSSEFKSDIDPARYTSNGEIYWCVEYIKKNLSWVNNIYIVTNGQDI